MVEFLVNRFDDVQYFGGHCPAGGRDLNGLKVFGKPMSSFLPLGKSSWRRGTDALNFASHDGTLEQVSDMVRGNWRHPVRSIMHTVKKKDRSVVCRRDQSTIHSLVPRTILFQRPKWRQIESGNCFHSERLRNVALSHALSECANDGLFANSRFTD